MVKVRFDRTPCESRGKKLPKMKSMPIIASIIILSSAFVIGDLYADSCKSDMVLLHKAATNEPVCVTPSTAEKLIQRGWALETSVPEPARVDVPHTDTWNSQSSASDQSLYGTGPSSGLAQSPALSQSGPVSVSRQPWTAEGGPLGYAVGGAQDINNFRENIENGYLPLYTDITYEGLFYDYYFDTGKVTECEKLFCPSYSYAISPDPFSKNDEYYLTVGLNSGIKKSDFERKKLNLVIVMDVSGSMSSSFNRYYYDQFGNQHANELTDDDLKSKMQLANESVVGLIDNLTDDDNLGMVLFSSGAHLAKPLESIGHTDIAQLKSNVLEIDPGGRTHMEAGMKLGTSIFDDIRADPTEYENRIIFLTDAMPNLGSIGEDSLGGMLKNNAERGIYATFIGIGVDFHTGLVEELTKVRGTNYYSVHSASEFKEQMVDEFEFMVTPLVFNLALSLDAQGYKIKEVYGSPEADESTGQIMRVNTLFPSKTEGGQTKGGIVLLKLEKTSTDGKLVLDTSYEDRTGKIDGDSAVIEISSEGSDYYENSGIRKGILLSRYAELMQTWIYNERAEYEKDSAQPIIGETRPLSVFYEDGIHVPDYVGVSLGQWERQSIPLLVSSQNQELISEFAEYFKQEMSVISDDDLSQEISILEKLAILDV